MAVLNNVAKPGTISEALISIAASSNGFGNDDGATNKVLVKVSQIQIASAVQVVETTGDGDQYAKYDHGSMLRVSFAMGGYALANDVIGLNELASDTNGDAEGNGDYLMQFKYHGSTREIRGRAMIESIVISYSKQSPVVALQMRGYLRLDPTALTLEKANG